MGSRIFVGGLPYAVTENELRDLFVAHGEVESANVVTDKFTGQSRGFGFVEMASDDDADSAIEALDGSEIGGRKLTVNKARPREDRFGGGGGGGGGGGRGSGRPRGGGGGRGGGDRGRDRW